MYVLAYIYIYIYVRSTSKDPELCIYIHIYMHISKSFDVVQSVFYGSMPLLMAFFKNKKKYKKRLKPFLAFYIYNDA